MSAQGTRGAPPPATAPGPRHTTRGGSPSKHVSQRRLTARAGTALIRLWGSRWRGGGGGGGYGHRYDDLVAVLVIGQGALSVQLPKHLPPRGPVLECAL